LLVVLTAAVLVFFFAWLPRHKNQEELERRAHSEQHALPRVHVVRVKQAQAAGDLLIPGTTQSFTEANVYARASGYISKRFVDIGDRVQAGQLLAVIDAPDLDRQVEQARAGLRQSESNLAQVQAQLHLASLNWDRYRILVAKGVLSRQEGDTQEAAFRVSEANVRAAENTVQGNRENLDRLRLLQGYERVTAPFRGVVTARNIEIGTLITAQGTGVSSSSVTLPGTTQAGAEANNAGSSGSVSSATTPATGGAQGGLLFTIADTDSFRVLVSVPESYSYMIRVGQPARLQFQETPGETFEGHVTRTSASIDQNTRTLLVEVQVRNRRGLLMPGMYAQVSLVQSGARPALLVPGEAVVIRNGRTELARVLERTIHFAPVSLGRDYGEEVEVASGVQAGDVIAMNVSDEVTDGAQIEPNFSEKKPVANTAGQTGKAGAPSR